MKLLASDFDNTLLFDNRMKEDDVKAIHSFQKQGYLFGLCTGRSLEGVVIPSRPYHIHYDFYILLSGALILNKDQKVIFQRTISMSLINEIYTSLHPQNVSIIYQGQAYILSQEGKNDYPGIYIQSIDDLDFEYAEAFSLHYQVQDIGQTKEDRQWIQDHYGDKIEAFQNNEHIDLAAKGCSKGNGIKIIQDYFHLEDDNMHAIGDSWNDLPMLDAVKKSYTFTYAHPDVKSHAHKIVDHLSDCILDIL